MGKLQLKKRECDIHLQLIPYGGGWMDVYLNIGGDHLYFIISSMIGNDFSDLMRSLYHLYPKNTDPEEAGDLVYYQYGICESDGEKYTVVEIVENIDNYDLPLTTTQLIPWKAAFTWEEESAYSSWSLERLPTEDTDFTLKVKINLYRGEEWHYSYEVRYQDFCYAVAKACTEILKTYGFYGYHYSVYTKDIDIRYLLFLKCIALDNFEPRQLVSNGEGHGVRSSFNKELEMLLFDM